MENQSNPRPTNSMDGFARPSQPLPASDVPRPSMSLSNPPTDTPAPDPAKPTVDAHEKPTNPKPIVSGGSQKKSKMWTVILVLLILIIFVGGVYGVYTYQQNKIDSLNKQVSTLTTSNESLKSAAEKNGSTAVSITSQSTGSTLTVFKIPELGVSLSVPSTLADLTYVASTTKTSVNLSTTDLATADKACTASTTVAPLGTITKANGTYPAGATTTLIKQYSTYYVAYTKPTGNCSTAAQVNALAASLTTDLTTSFSTIAVIS